MRYHAAMQGKSVAIAITIVCWSIGLTCAGPAQLRLIQNLMEPNGSQHSVLERPAANDNETVTVMMSFNIQQIVNLDAKEQYLESLIWIEHYWVDSRMIWDPVDYGGIQKIRLPPNKLWRPDILMYNSADQKFDGTWPVNLVIEYTGSVSYIPPAMLKSTCKVDVRWFPFDEQCCILKFGSWTYDDRQVNLTIADGVRMENLVKNGEFHLAEVKAKRFDEIFAYAGGEENYPYILVCVHLQRLALYYIFNLIVPAVLILSMSLMVFVLPVESGEKMGLSITVLLSLSVFTLVVAESLPRTSEATPLLGIYFTVIMFFCSIAVIVSVIVLNVHHFPDLSRNPPTWIRLGICYYLARYLRMRIPDELREELEMCRAAAFSKNAAIPRCPARCPLNEPPPPPVSISINNNNNSNNNNNNINSNGENRDDLRNNNNTDFEDCLERLRSYHSNTISESPTSVSIIDRSFRGVPIPQSDKDLLLFAASLNTDSFRQFCSIQLYLILKELRVIGNQVRSDSRSERTAFAWHFASAVVDRMTLYIFVIVTAVCAGVVLLWRPQNVFSDHDLTCPCANNTTN